MTLSYTQIYNLWQSDGNLKSRVQVALIKYAQYLKGLGASANTAQQTWCNAMLHQDAQVQLDSIQAMKYVVTDATTLQNDGTLTDAQLQSICENWVNNVLLV